MKVISRMVLPVLVLLLPLGALPMKGYTLPWLMPIDSAYSYIHSYTYPLPLPSDDSLPSPGFPKERNTCESCEEGCKSYTLTTGKEIKKYYVKITCVDTDLDGCPEPVETPVQCCSDADCKEGKCVSGVCVIPEQLQPPADNAETQPEEQPKETPDEQPQPPVKEEQSVICASRSGWYPTDNGYEYREYFLNNGACEGKVVERCTNACEGEGLLHTKTMEDGCISESYCTNTDDDPCLEIDRRIKCEEKTTEVDTERDDAEQTEKTPEEQTSEETVVSIEEETRYIEEEMKKRREESCKKRSGWYPTDNGYEYREYFIDTTNECSYFITQTCEDECTADDNKKRVIQIEGKACEKITMCVNLDADPCLEKKRETKCEEGREYTERVRRECDLCVERELRYWLPFCRDPFTIIIECEDVDGDGCLEPVVDVSTSC